MDVLLDKADMLGQGSRKDCVYCYASLGIDVHEGKMHEGSFDNQWESCVEFTLGNGSLEESVNEFSVQDIRPRQIFQSWCTVDLRSILIQRVLQDRLRQAEKEKKGIDQFLLPTTMCAWSALGHRLERMYSCRVHYEKSLRFDIKASVNKNRFNI